MGTPDFAVPCLEAVLAAGHQVAGVFSQPPRPAGRGHKERPSPVHALALSRGLPVLTPKSLRRDEAVASFRALNADAAVVVAYGLILPPTVLAAPRLGCVNVHASLLPRWRGAAPIQRAIEAGDTETGVTIMRMDEGLDTGPTLLAEKIAIGAATTGGELHDHLAALGARLVTVALAGLAAGTLNAVAQPDHGVTYAAKLSKDEGRLDWTLPASLLDRRVRAFNPWPGAWFELAGERFKVLACQALAGPAGQTGRVLDERLTVACGDGALRLLELQRSGRAPLTAEAFLRGFALPVGSVLPCPATN